MDGNEVSDRKERVDAIQVKKLSELLAQVRDEQSYIVMRERTHRNTAESTNGRVKWWSIFQLGVLLGEGIFQVWWLKRFFEVSRQFLPFSPSSLQGDEQTGEGRPRRAEHRSFPS